MEKCFLQEKRVERVLTREIELFVNNALLFYNSWQSHLFVTFSKTGDFSRPFFTCKIYFSAYKKRWISPITVHLAVPFILNTKDIEHKKPTSKELCKPKEKNVWATSKQIKKKSCQSLALKAEKQNARPRFFRSKSLIKHFRVKTKSFWLKHQLIKDKSVRSSIIRYTFACAWWEMSRWKKKLKAEKAAIN